MNGPDHYREAERLLAQASAEPEASKLHRFLVSEAAVHAELAKVALIVDTAGANAEWFNHRLAWTELVQ